MKIDFLKTINSLNFSNDFWKYEFFYKHNIDKKSAYEEILVSKIILGNELLDDEIIDVWQIYNLSSSILFRILCLISLAEFYLNEREFNELNKVKDIFIYLLGKNKSLFYKKGFLVEGEVSFFKRLNEVFSKNEKYFLFDLPIFYFFQPKVIVSFLYHDFFGNLDEDRRIALSNYFFDNLDLFFSHESSFKVVLVYFKAKQNFEQLKILVDEIYKKILDLKIHADSLRYQQYLESCLEWIGYSSNKEEKKNKILMEIRENSTNISNSFNSIPYDYTLSHDDVAELLSQYSHLDSTFQIMLNVSYNLINCYQYEENPQVKYLHESFTMTYLDFESTRLSSLGNDSRDLNIKRGKQSIEIYSFIAIGVYMPYLRKRKDFDYTLHNLNVFNDERNELVYEAINMYLQKKHFLFISAVLPLIESKLRSLLSDAGEVDIQLNDKGGFDYRVIGSFFRSKYVEKYLSKSELFVMSLILDERSGFNLRNKLAHGLMKPHEFNGYYSDILILVLVFISSLDFKE